MTWDEQRERDMRGVGGKLGEERLELMELMDVYDFVCVREYGGGGLVRSNLDSCWSVSSVYVGVEGGEEDMMTSKTLIFDAVVVDGNTKVGEYIVAGVGTKERSYILGKFEGAEDVTIDCDDGKLDRGSQLGYFLGRGPRFISKDPGAEYGVKRPAGL